MVNLNNLQDVWLSIGGLVFVVIFCLKMVTIADVKFMQYRNMVNGKVKNKRFYIYQTTINL